MGTPPAIIPERFKQAVARQFGDAGRQWLLDLPALLHELSKAWHLQLGPPVDNIKSNYVAYAHTATGTAVVLKVGVPHLDLKTEIDSLRHYRGRGMVTALASAGENAILLERINPGTNLHTLKDNRQETQIFAEVVAKLRHAPPSAHHFPNWMDHLDKVFRQGRLDLATTPDFPRAWIDRAEQAVQDCRLADEEDVLLHADLHHDNILFDNKKGWIAIDPKGRIGHPGLEVGRFSFNWLPKQSEAAALALNERIAILTQALGDPHVRERALVDVIQCLCETIGKAADNWKRVLLLAANILTH